MKAVSKILAGTAAVAAVTLGAAAPAAAQYYPGYGGYGGGGLGDVIVGQVLNNILRGGNPYGGNAYYGTNNYNLERAAVDQCARATEQRLNGQSGYYGGYNNGYGYNNAGYRVVQIDRVERTRNGNMRVYGQAANTAYQGNYGYGYNQRYGGAYNQPYGGYQQAAAPYRFSCKFERNGRITDLDLNRNRTAYRYGY
ncbi:hypothetical protein GCM10022280_24550 [Sphingomonas swuensis]|uniref:17 kDa surface antigen n=1 Tax=Sphingomonas swuensis TaxID=977800 RepID=A0ABP7T9V0_9SPHN